MNDRHNPRAPLALALAFPLLVAYGCASYEPVPAPAARDFAAYRVGAPDTLSITILPDPPIERELVVRPDGMISIDLIGDVWEKVETPFFLGVLDTIRSGRHEIPVDMTGFGEGLAPNEHDTAESARTDDHLRMGLQHNELAGAERPCLTYNLNLAVDHVKRPLDMVRIRLVTGAILQLQLRIDEVGERFDRGLQLT